MKKTIVLVIIATTGMLFFHKPVKEKLVVEITQEVGLPIEAVNELREKLNP